MKRWLPLLALLGCVAEPTTLDGAPCPCAEGFVCCEAEQTCRTSASACALDSEITVDASDAALDASDAALGTSDAALDASDARDARPDTATDAAPDPRDAAPDAPVDGSPDGLASDAAIDIAPPGPAFIDVTGALGPDRSDAEPNGLGLTVGDFDGDGFVDLYFSISTVNFSRGGGLHTGGPDFTFTNRRVALGYSDLVRHDALYLADFDGDGHRDGVLVYRFGELARTGGHFGWLRGTPAGVEPAQTLDAGPLDERPGALFPMRPVDLDGDGDLDLFGCRRIGAVDDPDRLPVLFRNDAGAFIEQPLDITADPSAASMRCYATALADFDADGDPDLALCDESLRLYRNDGAGRWVDVTEAQGLIDLLDDGDSFASRCRSLDWVDVDADGRLDLTWTWDSGDGEAPGVGTYVALNTGERFRPAQVEVVLPEDDVICSGARAARTLPIGNRVAIWLDADGDGDQDVVFPVPYSLGRCPRPPYLLRSEYAAGSARFVAEPIPLEPAFGAPLVSDVHGFVTADLDQDGDLDLATHDWSLGRRLVLRNMAVERGAPRWRLTVVPITDADGDATDEVLSDDRTAPAVAIQVDLDGPPDAPDFAPGVGALATWGDVNGHQSQGMDEALFGLGERDSPVWVRVTFSDGSTTTQRVEPGTDRVEIRDCADDCVGRL